MSNPKKWGSVVALCAIAVAASAASYQYLSARFERDHRVAQQTSAVRETPRLSLVSRAERNQVMETFNAGTVVRTPAVSSKAAGRTGRATYIVLFSEDSLATYKGGTAGISAPQRKSGAYGAMRLDSRSPEALNYVSYLQGKQRQMERQMSGMIQRPLQVRRRMQHAVNGIATDMSAAEAARVSRMGGVRLVEEYREYVLETDVGPTLIGAPIAWAGSATLPGGAPAVQGEGIIAGLIDSGINFGSPSFAGTDPVDGYVHANPLGAGVYLGTCAAGGVDAGRCNEKLIGGYDFVCAAPGNQCGVAGVAEEPGFGDTNGHGSHTASTTVGNRRDVVFNGASLRISGVAPRANIIAYDACYTNTTTGQGLCPNVSTVASINQAIADGVDVINYSIGGGVSPWTEATSLAFLSATDAGIFVATSAGNSGPAANTLSHLEPWTSATAASQHGRGGFGTLMQVTGPLPVPANLQPVVLNNGTGGVAFSATIPGTTPLIISAGIAGTADGCIATPYPAGSLTGAIVVIRRGTCSFSEKTNNASSAGAIAVIIANNQVGTILPSVPGTTIPVFSVSQTDGNALAAFGSANPTTTTAQISFPGIGLPNVADALASFSSRGPAGNFDLVKPDVTAPGVDILATLAGTSITGFEQLIGTISGTSMASPHQAGAAALIRQARPTWTVAEIKSALMMTATTQVYTENQVTLANAFARGSGRLRIERAIRAGLVLNETTANYNAANPATGGNPATLNLASMANGRCAPPSCSFTRTFRNPGTSGGLWRVSVNGLPGTANPALAWILPGATRAITFTVNSSTLPANNSFNFGEAVLELVQSGAGSNEVATLRLPIAVAVQPPIIALPASVSASVVAGNNGSTSFNIGNTGGSILNYTASTSGNGNVDLYNALRGAINSGFRNTVYSDPATAGNNAQFSADDFDLTGATQLTSISAEGFVVSGLAFPGAATSLTWSIYPDAAGVPAGNPQSAPGAAVWTYSASPTAVGVSTAGGFISLNLAAAGQNVVLPAGKYWLVVNTAGTFANRWAQFGSATGNGTFMSINVSTTNTGAWATNSAFAGLNMVIRGSVPCGAPWLGTLTPASGSVAPAGAQSTSLTLNSSALAAASYRAYVCVNSNDPARPSVALPVDLTVTP
jgi:subtilisin family serine protease